MIDKITLIPPREIKIPLGDNYGGIERIVEDLYNYLQGKAELLDWDSSFDPEKVDMVIDFSHMKDLSVYFPMNKYIAYTFATDAISWKRDIFATRAVKDWFLRITPPNQYVSSMPVVYPGIKNIYSYWEDKEDYLLFLGRIAPYKGPNIAIQVAKKLNIPIKVAGHTGAFAWKEEYVKMIKERCENYPKGEFIGDVTVNEKIDLLAHAKCLIAPSDWSILPQSPPESFGIVVVEGLLSGTPAVVPADSGMHEIIGNDTRCGEAVTHTSNIEEVINSYADAVKSLQADPKECLKRGLYFTTERFWKDLSRFLA